MNPELTDEASGIAEIEADSSRQSPKLRLLDAVVTAAIIACLAVYVICGALILYYHLY